MAFYVNCSKNNMALNLAQVLNTLTVRKTVDLVIYLYTTLVVALWIGQQIPSLTYTPFTYTSAESDGASYDHCSPEPLYAIPSSIINSIYDVTFNSTSRDWYANSETLCVATDCNTLAGINKLKVQILIMDAAGLGDAVPPFHLFAVQYTHYCIGVQHRSVAYDKDPPNVDYSVFWQYVKDTRSTIYAGYTFSGYLLNIELLYYMPVWVYLLCLMVAEIYMIWRFYVYENTVVTKATKMEPVLYFAIFGKFLPDILDALALIFIALKVSGICFVNDNDIFVMAGLHMAAMVLRCVPLFIMRYSLSKTPTATATPTGTALRLGIGKRAVNFNVHKEAAPPRNRSVVLIFYFMFGMMAVIAGMWVSNDLPSANVAVFDSHCESINGVPSTVDSCVGPDGSGYRSTEAHYLLLWFSPPLLLLIWRLGYFYYFASRVTQHGTIDTPKPDADSIDIELQAGVASIGTWFIKIPSSKVKTDVSDDQGIEICYATGINGDPSISRVRLLMTGRFTLPFTVALIAILLGILKLSEYSFWNGLPWWGISVMVAVAIGVSALTEFGAIGYHAMLLKQKKTAGSSVV